MLFFVRSWPIFSVMGQIVKYFRVCRPNHSILLLEHGSSLGQQMSEDDCVPIKLYL
jgi:hypothetical protein